MPLPEWSTRDNTVGLLRLEIMRIWEREKEIEKTGLSGNMMSVANTTFIYPSIYVTYVM